MSCHTGVSYPQELQAANKDHAKPKPKPHHKGACNCAQMARYAAPVAPCYLNPFQGPCMAPLHRRAQACCQMSSHECYSCENGYHTLSTAYGR